MRLNKRYFSTEKQGRMHDQQMPLAGAARFISGATSKYCLLKIANLDDLDKNITDGRTDTPSYRDAYCVAAS